MTASDAPTIESLTHFCTLFQPLTSSGLPALEECYSDDVDFADPLHRHVGRDNLMAYYADLMEGVRHCHFEFHDRQLLGATSFLTWTMELAHPRLRGGRNISVAGCSHLQWQGQRVCRHRDYFDVGAMLYEHLPVVGWMVKGVKKRL
ncbi:MULTISPECIES: nuclear transport factor 2 family protein [Salinicola]|uniref:nuclear transport factor 2 family protein n=1 Tax=Salinicola TaxID=404432 RepID=UPI000DA12FED|nr:MULTISPECIES: nuclear transport factor 2 family protein [Salinicola]